MFDGKVFGQEIAALVKTFLAREMAGISVRLAAIEKRLDELPVPRDGKDADTFAIAAQVRGELEPCIQQLAASVKAITIPELPELPDIAGMIAEAVAALPAPKDGEPGQSVTVDDCLPAITAAVDGVVAKAIAAIPAPKDGDPGASVSIEDVRPLIAEAARIELSTWERPKDGEPGKDGKMPVARAWADRVHYEGDVVTWKGATYQAQRDTGRDPGHEDWTCLAARGVDGAAAKSPKVRSTWTVDETYVELDIVALGGSAFIARHDGPGPCPGDGWQLISSQGKRGNQGEAGKSIKGDPGRPGDAVVSMAVDDQGMLTLTNGDGSTVECDLYPVLAKLGQA